MTRNFWIFLLAPMCLWGQNTPAEVLGAEAAEALWISAGSRLVQDHQAFFRHTRHPEFFDHLASSAPAETVLVQGQPMGNLGINILSAEAYFSFDEQASWNSAPCAEMSAPGFSGFWDCTADVEAGSDMYWWIKAESWLPDGVSFLTQAPVNTLDIMPPTSNLMCSVASEAENDVENGGPDIDITDILVSYSSDRVYVQMTTVTNLFPLGEFFGPWFLYGAGLSNPEQDITQFPVVVYALGFGDGAFGNLYPGLIKLVATPSGNVVEFSYVTEDIEYVIHEDGLFLSVDISYIVDDPDFGNWPNEFGGLLVTGMTASADIDQNITFHDATEPSVLVLETGHQSGNNPPALSNASYASDTNTLHVTYTDPDGNLPVVRRVSIDRDVFPMVPESFDYAAGADFFFQLDTSPEDGQTVAFTFSDGAETVQTNLVIGENPCPVPGDMDGSGVLDVIDIVMAVAAILDGTAEDNPCLDLNSDGAADIIDLVLMVDMILNP